jgi:hypothetical protein
MAEENTNITNIDKSSLQTPGAKLRTTAEPLHIEIVSEVPSGGERNRTQTGFGFVHMTPQVATPMNIGRSPLRETVSLQKEMRSSSDLSRDDSRFRRPFPGDAPNPPARNPVRLPNYITMGTLRLEQTNLPLRVAIVVILATIRTLSVITAIGFWIGAIACLRSFLNWTYPAKFTLDLTLRYVLGATSYPLWGQLFPECENRLRFMLHISTETGSRTIMSRSYQVCFDHPMPWSCWMVFMFVSHHLACLTYDCVNNSTPTARVWPNNFHRNR